MLISLNWLKEFIDLPQDLDAKDLGLKLTMTTMEIDEVIEQGANLDEIVVGKVLEIKKHPNADKLKLVSVDLGKGKLEVVCGGTNLKKGMLVAFAKEGAMIKWHGEGELVKLTKAKIRGVESSGMICAAAEIGLSIPAKEGEIIDLSYLKDIKLGTPLKKALGLDDILYEIDNKSITHRPDLWGHYGIAREVAAIYEKKLKDYPVNDFETNKAVDLKIEVKDFDLCRRFMGVVLGNIKVSPSPAWLANRLSSVGLRPINNIVDVTNYIAYELGQPMHAYDRKLINGDKLGARLARESEKFTTLDGQARKLTKADLLIIDAKHPVALAGVMGGENSEISEGTKEIILEAANFDPATIRKTSARLGLRTDASMRFEKSLDPNWPELAIKRAVNLIQQLIPGAKVISKVVDQKKFKLNQGPIALRREYLTTKMGIELSQSEVTNILEKLGFQINFSKDIYDVFVPTWRATRDIAIPDDLVEEVSRVYGYDNIDSKLPGIDITPPRTNLERLIERKIKNILVYGCGFNEVYNYSFVNEKQLEKLGVDYSGHIRIKNPLSSDQTMLRQSLIPNLIKNVIDNLRFFEDFKIFEVEQVFLKENKGPAKDSTGKDLLPSQPKYVSGIVVSKNNAVPFYEAKGVVEKIFQELNLAPEFKKAGKMPAWAHPLRSMDVYLGKKRIGLVTELNPQTAKNLDIDSRCGIFDLLLEDLVNNYTDVIKYQPIAKYPAITLDTSMIIDQKVLWQEIEGLILKTGGELLRSVVLFDVYMGKGISENKKSLAFHLIYRADDKTLTLTEAQKINQAVQLALIKKFKAEIRK